MFQSARPVKGATPAIQAEPLSGAVSIRAPREGRDDLSEEQRTALAVSIRAPREGRDAAMTHANIGAVLFQSARPVKGATL